MMYTIRKTVRTGNGFRERLHIKGFKTSEDMYKFLNKQVDNTWNINSVPDYYGGFNETLAKLKPGTYAMAGGEWRNIKSLDHCILAHI